MVATKDLRIRYTGDTSGVTKALGGIQKQHQSFGSRLKSGLGGIGKGLMGSFFNPITGAAIGLGIAFNEAGEAAQLQAQTGAVLKSTGGAANVTEKHVSALANRLGELAVIDNDVVREGQNMLLTFTRIRNEAGKGNDIFDQATLATLNLSTAMGTDMKSASVQVGKALNDPIRGMTALTRVGVTFDDKQRALIERMVESGDVMGAQKVILKELSKEFGGSAAASGKAASPIRKLTVLGLDLAESVGAVLIPILDLLVPVLTFVITKGIVPVLNAISAVIRFIVSKAQPALKVFGAFFGDVFRSIRNVVGPIVRGIAGFIGWLVDKIRGLIDWIKDAINWLKGLFETGKPVQALPGGTFSGRSVPGMAHGGIVMRPTLAMLAERGPEAVVPLSRGGGFGSNVTVIVQGSVVTERDLTERIRTELVKIARRNGG